MADVAVAEDRTHPLRVRWLGRVAYHEALELQRQLALPRELEL